MRQVPTKVACLGATDESACLSTANVDVKGSWAVCGPSDTTLRSPSAFQPKRASIARRVRSSLAGISCVYARTVLPASGGPLPPGLGLCRHRWLRRRRPQPVLACELDALETQVDVALPAAYRAFLTTLGTGPHDGTVWTNAWAKMDSLYEYVWVPAQHWSVAAVGSEPVTFLQYIEADVDWLRTSVKKPTAKRSMGPNGPASATTQEVGQSVGAATELSSPASSPPQVP